MKISCKEINIWKNLEEFIVPLQTVYIVDNKDINILSYGFNTYAAFIVKEF